MKRCPRCNIDYFDNALEFCLEDGARLSPLANFETERQTLVSSAKPKSAADTAILLDSNLAETLYSSFINEKNQIKTAPQTKPKLLPSIKEKVSARSLEFWRLHRFFLHWLITGGNGFTFITSLTLRFRVFWFRQTF